MDRDVIANVIHMTNRNYGSLNKLYWKKEACRMVDEPCTLIKNSQVQFVKAT